MLNYLKAYLDYNGAYPARIRARHNHFWNTPTAEIVRNTVLQADDSFSNWMDAADWQRKLSNKSNAKEFAAKLGCKTAKTYWKGRNIDCVDFSILPENYVIRPTVGHSSNMVFIMKKDFNLFDKKHYTEQQIRECLKKEVAQNPHLEFLFEEFLKNENGKNEILTDYKFFCFNGEVACIWVIDRLSPSEGYSAFYDENWVPMKRVIEKYPPAQYQNQPQCFAEMLRQAKAMSRVYQIFVRIDFYATNDGAVFGEFTPTPSMGGGTTPFGQKLLISYWDKYCKGMV
ncbi:hypothetical protein IM792_18270 [Mucilaginibacter sp. JRF]|uniref:ATP-grasp fold amidoligase family protein n=1 Tax=Mucilaginibacter sp. JRF TaxID=2780088 RepID=UPI00187EC7E0|nr:ATP-grasp fold amidoligase family protein [Mucilaginibacter sp. JRF]MBE9586404.1 hypothetical protein [Mucilaginibacter sp. JRF]